MVKSKIKITITNTNARSTANSRLESFSTIKLIYYYLLTLHLIQQNR